MTGTMQGTVGSSPKALGRVSEALKFLADHKPGVGYTKQAIERAAKRAGLSYWRAFDLWYCKARRVEQFEIDAIADAVEQKRREAERNEIHDLKRRLAMVESRLVQTDQDFHREDIAAFGFALSTPGLRGGGRS
jgi:hypothetical protein